MFYEYPKEFIIPVLYDEDLNLESSNKKYRDTEIVKKGLLEMLEDDVEEIKEMRTLLRDETINDKLNNKPKKESGLFKKNGVSDNDVAEDLEYDTAKKFLSEIDDEYAVAETGAI